MKKGLLTPLPSSNFDSFNKGEQECLSEEIAKAYRYGSSSAIRKVLAEVEDQAEKRIRAGFDETNFTLGVLNAILIAYLFGAFPQHFWILYLLEAIFLTTAKFLFMIRATPLNQAFYYFDFCWIMTFLGVIALLALFAGKEVIPDSLRKQLFLAAYGVSCGPLLGATMAMPFVGLIFHEVNSMTSVFIHMYPPLLLYILRWKSAVVEEAWPNTFVLDYEVIFFPGGMRKTPFFESVFGNTLLLYISWFVVYAIWQIVVGIDLPRSKRRMFLSSGQRAPTIYDTVFHANMRQGLCVAMGKILWKRSTEESELQCESNDFEFRDFMAYMGFHCLAAVLSMILFAFPCNLSPYLHGAFNGMLVAIVTWRGAKRYTYYSTEMYANIIRKQFMSARSEDVEKGFEAANSTIEETPLNKTITSL